MVSSRTRYVKVPSCPSARSDQIVKEFRKRGPVWGQYFIPMTVVYVGFPQAIKTRFLFGILIS